MPAIKASANQSALSNYHIGYKNCTSANKRILSNLDAPGSMDSRTQVGAGPDLIIVINGSPGMNIDTVSDNSSCYNDHALT